MMSDFRLERLGAHSEGAEAIFLQFGANTVGRTPTNNIVCSSKYVSRKHCKIFVTETGKVTVENDVTMNGIYINGNQRLDQNTEICLNVNDILGIGCDTSNDEIQDSDCFIYQIKRKECEVIVLDDSDEEEYKIQEEYSQMNLSEMKQEMIELQDFVDEYSRIKNDPEDDNFVTIEYPQIKPEIHRRDDVAGDITAEIINDERIDTGDVLKEILNETKTNTGEVLEEIIINEKTDTGDVFDQIVNDETIDAGDVLQEIVSNATKSYAEKNDLIKKMVPDAASLLVKDSKKIRDRRMPPTVNKNTAAIKNPPRTKELFFSIPLTKSNAMTNEIPEANNTSHAKSSPQNNNLQQYAVTYEIPAVSNTSHAKGSPRNNNLQQNVPAKINQRRNTCYPSTNLSSASYLGKRKISIIDAPHMQKRRKSISSMPDKPKRQPKVLYADSKWISKTVKSTQKKRSKEEKDEIKLKLAALVPKEKVVETKISRPNTKIPIKNTVKTRSDQLTDTIVKTMSTPALKGKINESLILPEASKRSRTARREYSKDVSHEAPLNDSSHSSRTRRLVKINEKKVNDANRVPLTNPSYSLTSATYRITKKNETKVTEKNVEEALECIHNGSNTSNNQSTDVTRNGFKDNNTNTTVLPSTSTSPAVKSILKKTNSIQKRRVTVTFVDDCRPKIAKTTTLTQIDEESCDDVIHNIMSLGMSALKESSNNPIPINGKNFAYKTVAHQYETLKHLQNVFIPLMKAELWKEIEDGYFRSKNTPATDAQMNYRVRDENHPNSSRYHCETKSSAVQNGALIIVSNVNSGKEFLGYIINKQTTNRTCYFQFITPVSKEGSDTYTCALLKLKQILYIRPNLKVFEALFKLKNSPLVNHILTPKYNCFQPNGGEQFQYNGYNSLNDEQLTTLQTVYQRMQTGQPFISLVEGPPGTGKSRLITNLVVQLIYGKEMKQTLKILVCAPSNAAIDILTKNLSEARKKLSKDVQGKSRKMKLVRFGVLEKMDRSVRNVSLQELIKDNNAKTTLIEQQRLMEFKKKRELDLAHYTSKNMKEKITAVRKEIEVLDAKMKNVNYDEKCLLEGANVICTTLNSCCALSNKISSMDVCIIDEATQCNEPTCLIPLQFGVKSLILVGDTKQLPSTVVSEIAKQYNYDQSLFQRLQKSFESENVNPILQLCRQYRMHPDILHWPNEYFYKNRLVSDERTKNFTLKLKPYTVFNLSFEQSSHTGQKHIANVDEANFVRNLLDFLITKADPKKYSYGIISAYSQQKDDLAKALSLIYPYVSVNTIDSCQGQERDIVIISIARTRGIGFLAIRQRLNVALTRAKKMLILCGNFNSLQSHSMWTNFLEDAKRRKLYIHFPKMDHNLLPSYFEKCLAT